jgi:hypothetical protein
MSGKPAWQAVASPCRGHPDAAVGRDVRCDCGSLLARWTPAGLELKCRRCKRHVVVPVEAMHPPSPED